MAIGRFAITPTSRETAAGIVKLDRLLIGNVDGDLQNVEDPAFHRIERVGAVTAVADSAGEPFFFRPDKHGDKIVVAQLGGLTRMELQQVDMVSAQAFEAARNAHLDQLGRPVCEWQSGGVTAFREEEIVGTAMTDGAADQFFAYVVTGRRINDVQTAIERAVEQFSAVLAATC